MNSDRLIYSSSNPPRPGFQTIDRILAPEVFEQLSPSARRIYAGIWNSANWKGTNPIWLDDDEVCTRAKVPVQLMNRIQSELVRQGLLHIVLGSANTSYEVIDPDQTQD
jgi:hypothetical protein